MRLYTKAFHENISILFDELQMARKWGQASIILTVHKSTFSQEKTKKALQKKIESLGYRIVEFEINKIQGNFIDEMLRQQDVENIVFYVSNLDRGKGNDEKDGYRILNLYRETLIEQKIKAIFFLTINEATALPSYAPDFWAFRHRVLGFASPHAPNSKKPPAGILFWQEEDSTNPTAHKKTNIASLSKMLTEMPDRAESISLRIDLQYELGRLYWEIGDYINAEKNMVAGLDLVKTYQIPYSKKKFLNSLAIIYYEKEEFPKSSEILESLVQENLEDCSLLMNLAIILFAKNKRFQAITKGKKAISRCPQNPRAWNSLGFLYYYAGKMDEAINCFQKAVALSPKAGQFYESLAFGYLALGLADKAKGQLQKVHAQPGDRGIVQDILEVAIKDRELAIQELKVAIDSGKLNKIDLLRDTILSELANQV